MSHGCCHVAEGSHSLGPGECLPERQHLIVVLRELRVALAELIGGVAYALAKRIAEVFETVEHVV